MWRVRGTWWWIALSLMVGISQTDAAKLQIIREGKSLTLNCTSSIQSYIERAWYKGYYNRTNPPPGTMKPLFYQEDVSGEVNDTGSRGDVWVNNKTFAMTIEKVKIQDDGYFTCVTTPKPANSTIEIFGNNEVQVYIQPVLSLGLDKDPLKENAIVTVNCSIKRLYPNISCDELSIHLGQQEQMDNCGAGTFAESPNKDGSYAYSRWIKRKLTREDNGLNITCTVKPKMGVTVDKTRTLDVLYHPVGSPMLNVSDTNPKIDDNITLTCKTTDVDANPEVSDMEWWKEANVFNMTASKVTYIRVSRGSTGNYSCTAVNSIGVSSRSIPVEVLVQPVKKDPEPHHIDLEIVIIVLGTIAIIAVLTIIIMSIVLVIRAKRKTARKVSTASNFLPQIPNFTSREPPFVVCPPPQPVPPPGEDQYSQPIYVNLQETQVKATQSTKAPKAVPIYDDVAVPEKQEKPPILPKPVKGMLRKQPSEEHVYLQPI